MLVLQCKTGPAEMHLLFDSERRKTWDKFNVIMVPIKRKLEYPSVNLMTF